MPKFAANLSMMFTEHDFLDRFEAASKAGFTGVEFLFPYAENHSDIAARLKRFGLTQALFNMPPGDWEAGERGISARPGREDQFRNSVTKALEYAQALDCRTLHCMAGIPDESELGTCRQTYIANLRYAAQQAAKTNRTVIIEPLNSRDVPGYFLGYQDDAVEIIKDVDEPNIGLQFDLYHCQIMQGDLAMNLKKHMPYIRHIQIAGVPERHEPDVGEINYPYLLDLMDELGYTGWVGCEYNPKAGTEAGLGWLKDYLARGDH